MKTYATMRDLGVLAAEMQLREDGDLVFSFYEGRACRFLTIRKGDVCVEDDLSLVPVRLDYEAELRYWRDAAAKLRASLVDLHAGIVDSGAP